MKLYGIGLGLYFYTAIACSDALLGLPNLVISRSHLALKIELGKQLFNDVRLSQDGTVSCASCHQENKGFADGLALAVGINGQQGTRNAPTVMNAAFYKTLFLDGRASSLEEQALGPFLNPIEHGLKSKQALVALVKAIPDYVTQFKAAFDAENNSITAVHIAQAIASFERTLISGNSRFDQYLFGRDRQALTESEARGLRLFRRKGNCSNCHEIGGKHALLMDNRFYNLGIGFKPLKGKLNDFLQALRRGDGTKGYYSVQQMSELGRFNVTHIINDIGKFKTPSLRNIALTAPYMHDGSLKTLEEVVEYYDKGGDKNAFLDAAIFPLHFTQQEKQDLVAFLYALTSEK